MDRLESAVFEMWFATKFDITVSLIQGYLGFFNDNSDIRICGTIITLPLEVISKVYLNLIQQ